MLKRLKEYESLKLKTKGGEIGSIKNFYFDDRDWKIRYIVVNTGNWLTGRLVLISPESIEKPDWKNNIVNIDLTKKQIEDSPSIIEEKPVSRQKETEIVKYYGWPDYWIGPGAYITGVGPMPPNRPSNPPEEIEEMQRKEDEENSNLRDAHEVKGYKIHTKEDTIGHVEDYIVDDESMSIYYVVIDTRDFFPGGKKVIISISWIDEIKWILKKLNVNLTKEKIEKAPEWDLSKPLTREFEEQLYKHFEKKMYWSK